jgi:hypothetical protein
MTTDKMQGLLDLYWEALDEMDISPISAPDYEEFVDGEREPRWDTQEALEYVMAMLQGMREMLDEGSENHEKLNRWLGFVQGVLWVEGVYTLSEMRRHNRSESSSS